MPGDPGALSVRALVPGEPGAAPRLDLAFETTAAVTAIMGPSGAGKTTLLQCIAGLVRPVAGRIVIRGEAVFDADTALSVPTHRRGVGVVFQSLALFPHLLVWENVAYGLPPGPRADRRARAFGWLERARAETLGDRRPATLSGGEAQRVALARALAAEPRLLLLDEPFSALNHELRLALGEVLVELLAVSRVPALLVTHDRGDAARLAERVLSLDAGRLVADTAAGVLAEGATTGEG